LAGDLQSANIDVWLDEHEILVGDSIHQRVGEGIDECDYLVVLLSRESVQSDWVKDEISAASSKEKYSHRRIVLPAVIDDLKVEEIPPLLRDKRRANIFNKYEEGLKELLNAIWGHEKLKKNKGS
jgi:hypothetical protein